MLNYFTDILPVYNSDDDRTVEKLSELYNHPDLLLKFISELIAKHFLPEMIQGKRILLKPNWVKHSASEQDEICLRTHDNFLLASLEAIITYKPASILIGDAPIQSCKWDKVVTSALLEKIELLNRNNKMMVSEIF